MNKTSEKFLQALKAALENKTIDWRDEMSGEEWNELFAMAAKHKVLPMIFEAVYRSAGSESPQVQTLFQSVKRQVMHGVVAQTMKTNEFLDLYRSLIEQDLHPIVVKGIICRNLYPNPDYRASGDEDVWIADTDAHRYHEVLLAYGMQVADEQLDVEKAYEVPYRKIGSPLYIELHKSLFPPESDAYGDLNPYFSEASKRAIRLTIDGVSFTAMNHTDHLFYLICHAFKHFVHSGFGIRQVCDIVLYANCYGTSIEWNEVLGHCREIHADLFASALFVIGEKYLGFEPSRAGITKEWQDMKVDESLMLDDLLDAGVFGDSSMNRKHSSNITLNAVSADKKGRKAGRGLRRSLFPPVDEMKAAYPYLQDKPYLLPVAWISRIVKYRKEIGNNPNQSAAESMKVGTRRVEMFRRYGIIERD